jgi:hypothetical protein
MAENTNPTWEHVNNAFEAGKKWERTSIASDVRLWLKYNTNWDQEYDECGRNENYGKIEELINVILGKE